MSDYKRDQIVAVVTFVVLVVGVFWLLSPFVARLLTAGAEMQRESKIQMMQEAIRREKAFP